MSLFLSIYSWNINGLRGARDSLMKFVSPVIDILCIQEMKCDEPTVISILNDAGFPHVFACVAKKKGYSGVAIASRVAPIRVFGPTSIIQEEHEHSLTQAFEEGRIIAAEFESVIVVSCYTPNSKRDLSRLEFRCDVWEPWIRQWLVKLLQGNKPVVFTGDLNVAPENIDIHNPTVHKPPRAGFTDLERIQFHKLIDSTNMIDSFRSLHPRTSRYSWWSPMSGSRAKGKGWRIDFILCDARLNNRIKTANVHSDVMGSDHCPISVSLSLSLLV